MLNDLCSLGTSIRRLIVEHMISPEFYQRMVASEQQQQQQQAEENKAATASPPASWEHSVYVNALRVQAAKRIHVPAAQLGLPLNLNATTTMTTTTTNATASVAAAGEALGPIRSDSVFDEFLFWCTSFEFPEPLVKFLLNLLTDADYKQAFVNSFVSQYVYISLRLLESRSDRLASRVVHMSVQLFSSEAMAIRAVTDLRLLHIVLASLHNMIVGSSKYYIFFDSRVRYMIGR